MPDQRVDILLTEKQLARSRTEAQKLICEGCVSVRLGGFVKSVTKPSEKFPSNSEFLVSLGEEQRFVSRAGLKLEYALEKFEIDVANRLALDVGQSTGGFSDCLLARGAQHVIGLEVGHAQLHPSLRQDTRVTCIEGYNARYLKLSDLPRQACAGIDVVVMDVSFISQHLILPNIPNVLKPNGILISLVKPQFEVGKSGLGKKGVVKDARLYPEVEQKIRQHCERLQLACLGYLPSPLPGGDGNREFLMFAQKNA